MIELQLSLSKRQSVRFRRNAVAINECPATEHSGFNTNRGLITLPGQEGIAYSSSLPPLSAAYIPVDKSTGGFGIFSKRKVHPIGQTNVGFESSS
jgi:hypothetical protein